MTHQTPKNEPSRTIQARFARTVSIVALLLLFLAGCWHKITEETPRKITDDPPPFSGVDTTPTVENLYDAYQKNAIEADSYYKGKKVHIDGHMPPELPIKLDALGNNYIGLYSRSGPGKAKQEDIRCYLFRPDKPIYGSYSSGDLDLYGVCVGRVNGVITLRDCYFKASQGGPDW